MYHVYGAKPETSIVLIFTVYIWVKHVVSVETGQEKTYAADKYNDT